MEGCDAGRRSPTDSDSSTQESCLTQVSPCFPVNLPAQDALSHSLRSAELASSAEEASSLEFPMPGFVTKPLLSSPERLDAPSSQHKDHSQQKDQRGGNLPEVEGPPASLAAVKTQVQQQQPPQDEQQPHQPLQSPDIKTDQSGASTLSGLTISWYKMLCTRVLHLDKRILGPRCRAFIA